jgi:hypothetical protein
MNIGILSFWKLPDQKEAFQHALPKKLSIPLCLGWLALLATRRKYQGGFYPPYKSKGWAPGRHWEGG